MTKKWVISLGGSRIVPEDVDFKFIEEFREIVKKHPSQKFVVVTGGGATARKYIKAIKYFGKKTDEQSIEGIAITRLHASFLARIFGKRANSPDSLPKNLQAVERLLEKNQVVFCGALRYKKDNTSDGTSADLAAHLNCPFINITDIRGLYTDNPKTNKNAKFISKISWKDFDARASKIKFSAGQHFVLDQQAAKKILSKKIPTYIVGSLSDVDKILSNKKGFRGTLISG
jgi:uridylate kinase